ncbi:uncharacterized protein LOC5503167 [Nematostella vectensis]|uniref:uncharacterized protein LOC5503167 n=1 Tax=Nematostella vectensis TaxID=45351 RepID=UPI002076DC26|nr:uncharacterized protein LOC5503167 [Nematostella vectensis]XP_032227337.2 uncharacterized protein LOC5503167 [Nematostella vectensis]
MLKVNTIKTGLWWILLICAFGSQFTDATISIIASSDTSNLSTKFNSYRNATNLTLQERCKQGLPLSIAVYPYPPYVRVKPGAELDNGLRRYTLTGMIPELLSSLLNSCCHPNTKVEFGTVLPSLRAAENILFDKFFDVVFPIYGYDVIEYAFRGHVFVRLFQAPRVVLLVQDAHSDAGKTDALITTLGRAWPMLVFILVIATLASMILWFLEHTSNSKEFPPSFFEGTWEGFWWALVTMTTVGYGDRTPKSRFGRVFAMLWILTGVTTISIFTALVTSSLWASTTPNFRLHGSVIGAINGSEEYRLAANLNAEVKAFSKVEPMLNNLSNHVIDGAMIDNYVITEHLEMLTAGHMRTEETMYYPITYGMTMSRDSGDFENCVNWMLHNYPGTRHQATARNLKPLKNPADKVSAQFRAAEGLFFKEKTFEIVTYSGMAVVGVFILTGVVWEYFWRRPKLTKHLAPPEIDEKPRYSKDDSDAQMLDSGIQRRQELKRMISKYRAYQEEWIRGVQEVCDERAIRNTSELMNQ